MRGVAACGVGGVGVELGVGLNGLERTKLQELELGSTADKSPYRPDTS